MSFEKFETNKKSTFVLDQLIEKLNSGEYETGDKLPTEDKLVKEIGVSRTSVREALAALRLTGVITSKAGRGTYVSKKPRKNNGFIEETALSVLERNTSPEEMFEARALIEKPIALKALEEINSTGLEEIKGILEKMEESANSKNYGKYVNYNKRFHLSISQYTGNEALENIMESMLSYMDEELWKEERRYYYEDHEDRLSESLRIHKRIFNALEKGNPTDLRKALEGHFSKNHAESPVLWSGMNAKVCKQSRNRGGEAMNRA